MKKYKIFVIIIFILLLVIITGVFVGYRNSEKYAHTTALEVGKGNQLNIVNREQILGNKEDLIIFSIAPNSKVHGVLSYIGVIKGGYFFEGNILINILDKNKVEIKKSNAMATSDWMTAESVDFEGSIDLKGLPKGSAYFEIRNDNPSDIRANDKSILIPIIIN
ncbi:MAG: Gmad2 immunoglobulin-like domain-containing protein [Candidatus Paceibacterota bacterium]|jgi:hypothetical protein